MVGTIGRWSVLIIVVCWERFTTSNKVEKLCPKPVVSDDAILVTLHSDVNLTCAGCEGRVSWSRRSPHGAPRSLTESGHLALNTVTYEDEDNYTCYKDGAPVCSVELIVKDEQQKNTSLTCYHRHPTHNITCTWRPTSKLHPSSSVTLIKAIFLTPTIFYPCTYNSSDEIFTCAVLYDEGDSTKHVFYLCLSSRADSQVAAKLEADVKDFLHIGPPLNVGVTPVENHPRRLRVSWSRPKFWESRFYALRYQIRYRVEDSLHQSNGTTEETAFVIHDAVMGRRHLVQVRAQEEFQKNWGSWSKEVAGVPWSDEAATTLVPSEYDPPITQEDRDDNDAEKLPEDGMTPRSAWIAPCVALGLVLFFFLGLWIRYQEIKVLKLQWGFLRSLFHSSPNVNMARPPANKSLLMSSPSSMAVTIPPLLDEK